MMKRLCYLSRCYRDLRSAGNKAKTDNESTLDALGAVNLGLPMRVNDNKIANFVLTLAGVMRFAVAVRSGDEVVLQYPVKKYFAFLCRVAHLRGARVTAIIHDLGSFRRKKLTEEQEIARLSHADAVIAANDAMAQWLSDRGLRRPVRGLGLYDYKASAFNPHTEFSRRGKLRLVYAGSLNNKKNSFLLALPDLADDFQFVLYGDKQNLHGMRSHPDIEVNGFIQAEDFVAGVDADFGLVWDGESVDGCRGDYGEYLRVNSPHKVSFYLRAGIPVVVWRQAGVAQVVEREGVGIAVDSLRDLKAAVDALSAADLSAMKQRAVALAKALDHGDFLRAALR